MVEGWHGEQARIKGVKLCLKHCRGHQAHGLLCGWVVDDDVAGMVAKAGHPSAVGWEGEDVGGGEVYQYVCCDESKGGGVCGLGTPV